MEHKNLIVVLLRELSTHLNSEDEKSENDDLVREVREIAVSLKRIEINSTTMRHIKMLGFRFECLTRISSFNTQTWNCYSNKHVPEGEPVKQALQMPSSTKVCSCGTERPSWMNLSEALALEAARVLETQIIDELKESE